MIEKANKPLVIQRSKEILGGTPVFARTRVPVKTLIDYIEGGETLNDFLKNYPSVSRKQALQVLELIKKRGSI